MVAVSERQMQKQVTDAEISEVRRLTRGRRDAWKTGTQACKRQDRKGSLMNRYREDSEDDVQI